MNNVPDLTALEIKKIVLDIEYLNLWQRDEPVEVLLILIKLHRLGCYSLGSNRG